MAGFISAYTFPSLTLPGPQLELRPFQKGWPPCVPTQDAPRPSLQPEPSPETQNEPLSSYQESMCPLSHTQPLG